MAVLTAVGGRRHGGLGAFIFYNTNILNHYLTADDQLARQADYEKKYKSLAGAPQPKITAVKVAVDLYPREQQVRMRGQLHAREQDGQADRHRAPAVLRSSETRR